MCLGRSADRVREKRLIQSSDSSGLEHHEIERGVMMHPRPFGTKFPLFLTMAVFSSVVVLSTTSASAQLVIRVPVDQPTIQSAIDATVAGDTVLVAPGTYVENINFHGKAITVESEQGAQATIIDGNLTGPVVTFTSGEGLASVLRGFTLQRGDASGQVLEGGGVSIYNSSPTIQANIITNNRACDSGAGIDADFSWGLIEGNIITNNTQFGCSGGVGGGGISLGGYSEAKVIDNVITGNSWSASGGGIALFAAGRPTITGNVIRGNSAGSSGGGIYMVNDSDARIIQNTIVGNHAGQGGGVFWSVPYGSQGPILVNNTIADNQGQGSGIFAGGFDAFAQLLNNIIVGAPGQSAIYCGEAYDPSPPDITLNNVFSPGAPAYAGTCGDLTGTNGNISADPLFVDPPTNDYHLGAGSPSIDAGFSFSPLLPATDIDGDQRIINGQIDHGVDEYNVPARPPSPPTNLTATRVHKTAVVSWSAPTDDGGSRVRSYTVTISDGRWTTVDAIETSVRFVDGIKKNETYTFSVVATNAIGSSEPVSVTLPGVGRTTTPTSPR
jgi:parallel beta-helix repeat protein